jgi:hypothetical protein
MYATVNTTDKHHVQERPRTLRRLSPWRFAMFLRVSRDGRPCQRVPGPSRRQPRSPAYTATDESCLPRCPSASSWRKGSKAPQHVQGPRRHHAVRVSSPRARVQVARGRFVTINKNSLSVPIIPLAEVSLTQRWRGGPLQARASEPRSSSATILPTQLTAAAKLGRPVTSRSASSPRSQSVSREGSTTLGRGPRRPPTMSRVPAVLGATS